MSNSNSNGQAGRGSYLDQLKSQLTDYKKPKGNGSSGASNRSNILAKYFVPREDKEVFRILPPKSGKKPILEAYFHVVELNGPGGKKIRGKAIYCPAHNNPKIQKKDKEGNVVKDENGNPIMIPSPCPLCNKYKKELSKQDNSLKGKKKEELTDEELEIWEKNREIFKDASKWQAKKYYILRGIDKGKMKDGVKFWRFKHNFKNQGTLDKLLPILTEYIEMHNAAYYDPEKGTDLSISMVDDTFMGRTYRAIAAISHRGPSKLHEDPVMVNEWLNDEITWRDVFKPKTAPNITPYQYLKLLLKGDDPYWDDSDPNNKHWVFPNNPELQEKANQRDRDLDSNDRNENIPMASDLSDDGTDITKTSVYDVHIGSDVEESTDTEEENNETPEPKEDKEEEKKSTEPKKKPVVASTDDDDNDDDDDPYDDEELPF